MYIYISKPPLFKSSLPYLFKCQMSAFVSTHSLLPRCRSTPQRRPQSIKSAQSHTWARRSHTPALHSINQILTQPHTGKESHTRAPPQRVANPASRTNPASRSDAGVGYYIYISKSISKIGRASCRERV